MSFQFRDIPEGSAIDGRAARLPQRQYKPSPKRQVPETKKEGDFSAAPTIDSLKAERETVKAEKEKVAKALLGAKSEAVYLTNRCDDLTREREDLRAEFTSDYNAVWGAFSYRAHLLNMEPQEQFDQYERNDQFQEENDDLRQEIERLEKKNKELAMEKEAEYQVLHQVRGNGQEGAKGAGRRARRPQDHA